MAQALAEFKRTHQLAKTEGDPSATSFSNESNETSVPGIQLGHSRHISQDKAPKRAQPLGAEVEGIVVVFVGVVAVLASYQSFFFVLSACV